MEGLNGEAVEAVADLAKLAREGELRDQYEIRDVNGEKYVNKGLTHLPKIEPAPGVLELSTLQGLIDFVRADVDTAFTSGKKPFIHVCSPVHVVYGFGAGGPYLKRSYVAKADARVPNVRFGEKWGIEAFLISLRSLFVLNDDVKTIINLLSNIDSSNAVKLTDDGMSQAIAVNRGVRGTVGVTLPPTVQLQPYRTFSEVTQPVSPFLLRLHDGDASRGILPTVSLTPADLGQWEIAATSNIKTFLDGAGLQFDGAKVPIIG